ncbi:hypothetical protein HZQ80_01870 [Elizabethkingia anophelis]|nr:hypothetical protein [Elizabethkingia anophelis]
MLVDLHKIAINEIEKISDGENKMLTIRIEEKVEIEKLITLNEILDKENFLISVIIESGNSLLDNKVSGIYVFPYLSNVTKLKIYVSDYDEKLENLNFLKSINNLSYLDISTNARKNLRFDELVKFPAIKHFSYLCEGLNNEQNFYINNFSELKYLAVYDLNLELLRGNASINELRVHRKLINPKLFTEKFPNIENLVLEKCSDLDFQKDIANHPNLVNISLRYMNSIYEVPKFKNPGKIKKVSLLGLRNLKALDNITEMNNLEVLEITNIQNIKIESFLILKELKKLKSLYIVFEKAAFNTEFEKFAIKNGLPIFIE